MNTRFQPNSSSTSEKSFPEKKIWRFACFICLLRYHLSCGNSGVRRTPSWRKQLDREMVLAGQRWTREAENATRPVFENAISILTRAGVPPNSIRRIVRQLVNHEDLTDDILKLAEENACQTIVVGRSSFPWFKETFHRHLADSLVRKATGITIWVVEQPSARL
jgi:nucleotide-binding universal stress UspA family protein